MRNQGRIQSSIRNDTNVDGMQEDPSPSLRRTTPSPCENAPCWDTPPKYGPLSTIATRDTPGKQGARGSQLTPCATSRGPRWGDARAPVDSRRWARTRSQAAPRGTLRQKHGPFHIRPGRPQNIRRAAGGQPNDDVVRRAAGPPPTEACTAGRARCRTDVRHVPRRAACAGSHAPPRTPRSPHPTPDAGLRGCGFECANPQRRAREGARRTAEPTRARVWGGRRAGTGTGAKGRGGVEGERGARAI